jgi:alkylated DNA repair dioxygenase AlkB
VTADHLNFHRDSERDIDQTRPIFSLSLGGERRFLVREAKDHANKHEFRATHNTLMVMRPGMQADWEHSVPKTKKAVETRVNLTIRYLT